jgi:sulfatase maturation enzyme AslB (radical SAM superfamily)
MIKEAVDYCSYESDYVKSVQYVLGTNGMLLTDLVLDFLIAHNFQLTISFDGIPEAQSFRSPDTFSFLNRLLDRLRIQHRDYFNRKVQIAITLIPETIVYLADSIEYFMQKSVQSISIMPVITHCHNWSNDYYSMLDTQLGRAAATSLTHYSQTGTIPVNIFRQNPPQTILESENLAMCGIMRAQGCAVDIDGTFYACSHALTAPKNCSSKLLHDCIDAMRIGVIGEPAFITRFRSLGERLDKMGIFSGKERKSSSYGRCDECEYLHSCFICPLTIAHNRIDHNPNIIPDFPCAFNRLALKYREIFPDRPNIFDALRAVSYR